MDTIFDGEVPRARLALLLRHFSELKDNREPWRIVYPLREVLLLVTCATIASCDDFDDIVAWGKHHLAFLRHFSEFHFGIPCERWLRILVNRIDPILFGRCFQSWIAALWPDRHGLIAIDGKTSRRTHDQRKGLKALHTLSAYATGARLTLAQLSVPEKTNEITAIPDLSISWLTPSSSKARSSPSTPWAVRSRSPTGSSAMAPIICLPSRAISRPWKAMSRPILTMRRPPTWSPKPHSKRPMDASKRALTPPPPMSPGSPRIAATRDSRASTPSRPSSRFTPALNMPTAAAAPRRATTSAPLPATSSASPPQHAATGASRACTGCSTSPSRTTCRAIAPVTAPRTWLPCAASPSTSCASTNQKAASRQSAKPQVGTQTSCSRSFNKNDVNLDSLPCGSVPPSRQLVRTRSSRLQRQ